MRHNRSARHNCELKGCQDVSFDARLCRYPNEGIGIVSVALLGIVMVLLVSLSKTPRHDSILLATNHQLRSEPGSSHPQSLSDHKQR